MNRVIRYIVKNPNEEAFVSYNTQLGNRVSYDYAVINARWRRGEVIAEFDDGKLTTVKDFRSTENKTKVSV